MSHAAGVGAPFPREVVRAMLAAAREHAGARPQRLPAAPRRPAARVPRRGDPPGRPGAGQPRRVRRPGAARPPRAAADRAWPGRVSTGRSCPRCWRCARPGLEPLTLEAKEGLALLNGTQMMGALGALLLADADRLVRTASVAAAMSVEALLGTDVAFAAAYQLARPHPGPGRGRRRAAPPAARQRRCSAPTTAPPTRSRIPYSLRCVPQVHGAVRDALDHLRRVLDIELNSATDNPLVFPGGGVADADTIATGGGRVISGGNFHGEPIALALDFAKLALAELGSISERRTALLVDPRLNGGLPPFLAASSGVESGMMIYQYTAAALASRAQGAGPPGLRRLDPDVGEPGGPRLDGLDRGAPRPVRPRRASSGSSPSSCWSPPRRSTCGSPRWRPRAATRRARCPGPASPRPTGASGPGSRTSTATASRAPTSPPRRRSSTTGCWRTWPGRRRSEARGVTGTSAPASPSSTSPTRRRSRCSRRAPIPGFDHRSCDYWEDADRGSKAIRLDWLEPGAAPTAGAAAAGRRGQPVPRRPRGAAANPFARRLGGASANPFLADDDAAGRQPVRATPGRRDRRSATTAPRKLRLLGRGLGVAGSYAKVLLSDDVPAAYCQFGPLTAYPRAQRTRDLYPALPDAPLPAVITCIATTAEARGAGLARALVEAVCDDLAGPRLRRGRDVPRDRGAAGRDERRDARRSGRRSGSSSRRRTSASRSCAASSGEVAAAGPPSSLASPALAGRRASCRRPSPPTAPSRRRPTPAPSDRADGRRRRRPASSSPPLGARSRSTRRCSTSCPAEVDGAAAATRTPRRPPRSRPTGDLAADVEAIARRPLRPARSVDRRRPRDRQRRPAPRRACSTTAGSGAGATRTTRASARRPAASRRAPPRPRSASTTTSHRDVRRRASHTYHVHLADPRPDRSRCTALGEGRFGERVVAGLTE